MAQTFKEWWLDRFEDCCVGDKVAMFNEYNNGDETIYDNDRWFFSEQFDSSYEAVESALRGNVNLDDEYIRFDGYGHLVSMDEYDAELFVSDYASDIFEYESVWGDYIDRGEYNVDENSLVECLALEAGVPKYIAIVFYKNKYDGNRTMYQNSQELKRYMENGFSEDMRTMVEQNTTRVRTNDGDPIASQELSSVDLTISETTD